ncbi:Protein MHF2-like [Vitis vinifera]|uniref:Protein MHF2-like n=1 Tax=Vitis vinifera TaxID=29760 RepID=A0A438GBT3_VITVI|nr:Protein MHF2-like [Vitis vinifera]
MFEPVFEHSQIPKPKSPPSGKQVPSSTRPTLVYSRKKTTIIEPIKGSIEVMLSKRKYVLDLLQETRKIGCKLADTPIDPNHKLREASEDATVDKGMYQILVGKLIYLSHTRLNIAYALSLIVQDQLLIRGLLQDSCTFLGGNLETWKTNANALKLSSELLRVFVIEAVERAATIAEAEGVNKIEATHLERILPQLLLDF